MTFANLPSDLEDAITKILQQQDSQQWLHHAQSLHERYVEGKNDKGRFLQDFDDVLAYLGMRVPATYAQILSALTAIQELIPSWKPKSLLDIGSGPGTAGWAVTAVWPDLSDIVSLDHDRDLISLGKQISTKAEIPAEMVWKNHDLREGLHHNDRQYDLVIIANVLNELSPSVREKIIGQAYNKCKGILVIIEPGTPQGSQIIESAAQNLSKVGLLLAPYIANSFVQTDDYYLHFPQRFIRPEFQRRVRQQMRDDASKASDWEDAKYAYVVISKIPTESHAWGRCVGPIETQKGFLKVPILTASGVTKVKVMKRNRENYSFAKRLRWGDLVEKNIGE